MLSIQFTGSAEVCQSHDSSGPQVIAVLLIDIGNLRLGLLCQTAVEWHGVERANYTATHVVEEIDAGGAAG